VSSHPGIAEVAVVGVADELEGQLPLAFATVRDPAMIATAERLDKNRIGGEAGRPGCLRFRNQSTRKQLMEAIARVTSAPEIAVQAPASI
jgi:acyl-CoA synthetase (AMP-forming)/AMP-acid ligase II